MKRIAWINEERLVLVGYDDAPFICSLSGNQWYDDCYHSFR